MKTRIKVDKTQDETTLSCLIEEKRIKKEIIIKPSDLCQKSSVLCMKYANIFHFIFHFERKNKFCAVWKCQCEKQCVKNLRYMECGTYVEFLCFEFSCEFLVRVR